MMPSASCPVARSIRAMIVRVGMIRRDDFSPIVFSILWAEYAPRATSRFMNANTGPK